MILHFLSSYNYNEDYDYVPDWDYFDLLNTSDVSNSSLNLESESGDTQPENDADIIANRRKRSTSGNETNNATTSKSKTVLKRTNSASSVLGLNVLLYQNQTEYWTGLVQNSFVGFKVRLFSN